MNRPKRAIDFDNQPSSEEIRAASIRISDSEGMSGTRRLKGILNYVMEETLAGRGDEIRAKTLALDVYGYSADEVTQHENVIRVDAGRLRRRLENYYNSVGQSDPIKIKLPKGTYTPEFVRQDNQAVVKSADWVGLSKNQIWRVAVGMGLTSLLVAGIWMMFPGNDKTSNSDGKLNLERKAIFEVSPSRLQAMNLAEQGRDLIFPAVEPGRLKAALLVFESAVALDDTYFGGHAGAAQVQAFASLLSGNPDAVNEAITKADEAAQKALALSPESAWSQSAMAMVEFSKRNWDRANALSDRALKIDPDDPHLVEIDALISLFSGDFDRVIKIVTDVLENADSDSGYVFMNALGSAKYHTGDYEGTVQMFEEAIADGAPAGPVSVAYLMAAHYRLGNTDKAKELAQKY